MIKLLIHRNDFCLKFTKFQKNAKLFRIRILRGNYFTFHQINPLNRLIHTTPLSFAPKSKKSNKNANLEQQVEDIVLPDLKLIEDQMSKRFIRLGEDFKTLRSGKPSADMLNHIIVDAYGSKTNLSNTGQITLQTASRLSIAVYDSEIVSKVSEAIRDCGMNLNPSTEGNNIIVNIPKASKESRDMLCKAAAKFSERSKLEVRSIRKDALDSLKKIKADISEDDARKFSKDVSFIY